MASRLNVTELDFDSIKNNLKDFLSQQTEFQDYDFEGSGLSVLLDVLAYNTHYNAYYLNMIANESFLNSASLRNSVVSHAKTYGYIPRSVSSPHAVINFTVYTNNNTPEVLNIPRGYKFMSNLVDGKAYGFITLENISVEKTANNFVFTDLPIYEGRLMTYSQTYDSSSNPNRLFTIPDENVDTSTLTVSIQESTSNTNTNIYTSIQEYYNIDTDSEVYFLQEGIDGKYQIYFGDGVLGKALNDGNIVIINYLTTSGDSSNGSDSFKATSSLSGYTNFNIDVTQNASGGSNRETVDSIKFNAPLQVLSQNRAVTKNDYIKLINQRYPHFDAINVWGGEDNNPPIYGKVFISAKPKEGFEITDTEKEYVKNRIIKPISIMTVSPEFVDVDYNYLKIDVDTLLDLTKTSLSSVDIVESVRQYIIQWASIELNQFNTYFNYSSLESGIQKLNKSIMSNEVEIMIGKKFRPNLTTLTNYALDYGVELSRGTSQDNFYSSPDFTLTDEEGIDRQCYFEEVLSSFTGVQGITVNNPGLNYTSSPTIEIVGDGSGATAVANIKNGRIEDITVTSPGIGYTSAIVRIIGGGGSMGEGSVILEGRYGSLRIVYYKSDAITNQNTKYVLNSGRNNGIVGLIDYFLGRITIDEFLPKDVNNDFGDISIYFKPKSNLIKSVNNKMLVLNDNDLTNISIHTKLK